MHRVFHLDVKKRWSGRESLHRTGQVSNSSPGNSLSRTGQVSIEYLIIVGMTVLLLFPLLYVFYSNSQSFQGQVTATQTSQIAKKVVDAADSVYYLGPPSQQTLSVVFPDGIKNVTILGNSVSFLISGAGAKYEVVEWSAANLTGNLSPSQGVHQITVSAQAGGVVISD